MLRLILSDRDSYLDRLNRRAFMFMLWIFEYLTFMAFLLLSRYDGATLSKCKGGFWWPWWIVLVFGLLRARHKSERALFFHLWLSYLGGRFILLLCYRRRLWLMWHPVVIVNERTNHIAAKNLRQLSRCAIIVLSEWNLNFRPLLWLLLWLLLLLYNLLRLLWLFVNSLVCNWHCLLVLMLLHFHYFSTRYNWVDRLRVRCRCGEILRVMMWIERCIWKKITFQRLQKTLTGKIVVLDDRSIIGSRLWLTCRLNTDLLHIASRSLLIELVLYKPVQDCCGCGASVLLLTAISKFP